MQYKTLKREKDENNFHESFHVGYGSVRFYGCVYGL